MKKDTGINQQKKDPKWSIKQLDGRKRLGSVSETYILLSDFYCAQIKNNPQANQTTKPKGEGRQATYLNSLK